MFIENNVCEVYNGVEGDAVHKGFWVFVGNVQVKEEVNGGLVNSAVHTCCNYEGGGEYFVQDFEGGGLEHHLWCNSMWRWRMGIGHYSTYI